MIAQRHRFHGHNKIDSVYRRGMTLRGTMLNLKYVPGNGSRDFRAAVVVSKKVSKSAVVRNRIRRRLYELLRQYDTNRLKGGELVFVVYSEQLAHIEADKLRAAVHDLLGRAVQSTTTDGAHAIVKP